MGRELYVDVTCTRRLPNVAAPAPANCKEAWEIVDSDAFHGLLTRWMDNSLVLYRGFPGCHYCWPDLLNGLLKSEGNADRPEFTMSNNGKGTTRWLPTADRELARGVSLQCCDQFTVELGNNAHVPIGFTVKINAGSARGLPLCWLNSGEIVVRGPLITTQYAFESITWMRNRNISYTDWPPGFTNLFLPPQRPYKPSKRAVEEWWASCRDWKDEARRAYPALQ